MGSTLASASGGETWGDLLCSLILLQPLGLRWCCLGGRKGEKSPAGERRRGGRPSGQAVCLSPGGRRGVLLKVGFTFLINCDNFDFC